MIKASGAGGRKDSSSPLSSYALLRRKESQHEWRRLLRCYRCLRLAERQIRLSGCRCLFRNMPNTSPKWAETLCRRAFRMVGCWRNTSPETSPSVSPFLEDPSQPPLRGGASRGSLRRGGPAFPPATAHKNHTWQLSRWEA